MHKVNKRLESLLHVLLLESFTGQNVRLTDIVPSPDGELALGIENGNSAALIDLEANEIDVNAPKVVRKSRRKLSELPGQMTFF